MQVIPTTEFVESYSFYMELKMFPILDCLILRKNKDPESFPTVRDALPLFFGRF
jgi:hypothetical protein